MLSASIHKLYDAAEQSEGIFSYLFSYKAMYLCENFHGPFLSLVWISYFNPLVRLAVLLILFFLWTSYDHSAAHAVAVILSVLFTHFLLAAVILATLCW